MKYLNIKKVKEFLIEDEIIDEFFEMFLIEIPFLLVEIKKRYYELDIQLVSELAHQIKTSVAYAGASDLVSLARKIEKTNSKTEENDLKKLISDFHAGCEELIEEIKEYRERYSL